jgi:hypothetical protein
MIMITGTTLAGLLQTGDHDHRDNPISEPETALPLMDDTPNAGAALRRPRCGAPG